jgi:hypothetical protein
MSVTDDRPLFLMAVSTKQIIWMHFALGILLMGMRQSF